MTIQPAISSPNTYGLRVLRSAALVTTLIFVSSCSSLRTIDARVDMPGDGKARVGVHYFLPRGILTIEGRNDTSAGEYKITIQRDNVPDNTDRYWLTQTTSLLHDDVSKFKVNENGLLYETVDSIGDPKIDKVIENLLAAAVNLGNIKTKLVRQNKTALDDGTGKVFTEPLRPFTVSFDPLDQEQVDSAEKAVARAGVTMKVSGNQLYDKALNWKKPPQWDARVQTPPSHEGIFYRPLTTVKVQLSVQDTKESNPFVVNRVVAVPDPQSIATYSMKRGAFAKRKQNVVMVNGEPREVDFDHPSELAAFTVLPVTITKTVLDNLPALTSLFYKPQPGSPAATTAETKKIEAETENIQAAKALVEETTKTSEPNGYETSVPLPSTSAPPQKPNPPRGAAAKSGEANGAKKGDSNLKGFEDTPLPKKVPADKGPDSAVIPPHP